MRTLLPFLFVVGASCLAPVSTGKAAETNTGIIVESVTDYGSTDQLQNAVPNGDGFLQGMTFPGSRFHVQARWTNGSVYDSDFADPEVNSLGSDQTEFDQPGAAISYFTGHGIVASGCSTVACNTTAVCTHPDANVGQRLPGTCRFSPFDSPRCCYMTDRAAVTHGSQDKFNSIVDYTGGPIRWGEDASTNNWARAGTNGGAHVVVLDISHGVLPPFWGQTLFNAVAGTQLIGTMMTAGGDTAIVSDRGSTFASFYRANENSRVADAWVNTMNSLPASEGASCPGGGGGHGFNGCGCNIVIGMDINAARAQQSLGEGWDHIIDGSNDAFGNTFYSAKWVCNYTLRSGDQSAWELP